MEPVAVPDPYWTVGDLLERGRRVAGLPPAPDAGDAAAALQARCAGVDPAAMCACAGRRARLLRLAGACEAYLRATDDLAAAALLAREGLDVQLLERAFARFRA